MKITEDFFGNSGFPVVILGSPRTGTSSLAFGLRKLGFSGDSEGHWLSLLAKLLQTADGHYVELGGKSRGTALGNSSSFDIQSLQRFGICSLKSRLILDFLADYHSAFGPYWIDKTPTLEMYDVIPHIFRFLPRLKIIYAYQRPEINISSRIRKFPDVGVEDHCMDYARHIHDWLSLRSCLDPTSFIEMSPGQSGFGEEGWLKLLKFLQQEDSKIGKDVQLADLVGLHLERSRIDGVPLETDHLDGNQRSYFESVALTAYMDLLQELGIDPALEEPGNLDVIRLPLTPGVRSIELTLSDGQAWNEIDDKGVWLFIHGPSVPDWATVKWRFPIPEGQWVVDCTVENKGSHLQRFILSPFASEDDVLERCMSGEPDRLDEHPAGSLIFEEWCNLILEPKETHEVTVKLRKDSEPQGLAIMVSPKHVNNDESWIRISNLRLEKER